MRGVKGGGEVVFFLEGFSEEYTSKNLFYLSKLVLWKQKQKVIII